MRPELTSLLIRLINLEKAVKKLNEEKEEMVKVLQQISENIELISKLVTDHEKRL